MVNFKVSGRQCIYALISITIALSITVSYQLPSYGNRWFEILRKGMQVIQITQISDADEVKIGEQINQSLLETGEIELNSNPQLNLYLNRIGQRLAQSSDRANIPYTFQVVNSDQINAFATMGGYVYINTGLMATAANEAELASVVAHEIGHIVGRHSLKRMRQQAIAEGLLTATGLEERQVVQLGIEVGFHLPRSREQELEADQLGLVNLKNAGYAPIAMISFMEKLLESDSSNIPSILSTHPDTKIRVVELQQSIDLSTAQQGDGLNPREHQRQIRSLL